MTDVIRRKIDRARQPVTDGAPGADRAWRLALARAARDAAGLELEVAGLAIRRLSLAEVMEIAPDHSLVALLDGPGSGLGVALLDPAVTATVIEALTLGRLARNPPSPRKPSRIDAAMTAGLIDRALSGLEEALAEEADLIWAGGFRYASFLEDIRPLALLVEEELYCALVTEVILGGVRTGQVILILPAAGQGKVPAVTPAVSAQDGQVFAKALAAQIMLADCRLDAVIDRLRLPLHQVMALQEGQVIDLPFAALDAVSVDTLDGCRVAWARLGQHRDMRAVKLVENVQARPAQGAAALPPAPVAGEESAPPAELRAAG